MELLAQARKSLNKALGSTSAASSQAHSQDSIACSLLSIAESLEKVTVMDADKVELIVRRLLDETKAPAVKPAKGKK